MYGVTSHMIDTYGEIIFDLSLNVQRRRGDPVRLLQMEAIEAQRADTGLTDAQIAARLGLTVAQVRFIRVVMERRRFRTDQYRKLFTLGAGRRYRPERDDTPRPPDLREDGMQLREALTFDPAQVRTFVEAGYWTNDTLSGWLTAHAMAAPHQPVIVHGEHTLSYQALQRQVTRLARALQQHGIQRGDVVAVQLPNVPEFLITYLAVCHIGGVLATIHMPYRAAEMETLLRHSRARALVCMSQVRDYAPAAVVLQLRQALPALDLVIAHGAPVEGALSLARLLDSDPPVSQSEPPVGADPFLLLFTSGTSASPKAVPLTYHTMLSNARFGVAEHRITRHDRLLSAAPFSHLYGLYSVHLALATGATMVLLPGFTPPDLIATLERSQATVLLVAPAHVAACRQAGLLEQAELSSLKLAIMAGSACPPELVRALAHRLPNGAVSQLWGMTELQAGTYTRPDDPLEVAATSAGRPSPGTEVRIVAPDGTLCDPGEEGELQVRGCSVFPGYFDNATANAQAFTTDGWFRTGDLAVLDAQGNMRLTGRSNDIINRGGVKFNPLDIETLLDQHPKVVQSAIVPMPDAVLGERACCFAVLTPGQVLTLEEVCAYLLAHHIARHKLPERLEILEEMPLTPTRKIIKGRLQALL